MSNRLLRVESKERALKELFFPEENTVRMICHTVFLIFVFFYLYKTRFSKVQEITLFLNE